MELWLQSLSLCVHICIYLVVLSRVPTEPHNGVPDGETNPSCTNEAGRVGDYAPEAQAIGGYGQDENHQEFQQLGGVVSEQH